MGTLIKFELKKILGNKAGMVACLFTFVVLVALAFANNLTTGLRDYDTGDYQSGLAAHQVLRANAQRHAGVLSDERVVADAAMVDEALALWANNADLVARGEINTAYDASITQGLDFWHRTGAIFEDAYYQKVKDMLDSTNPRASSLQAGVQARMNATLDAGFGDYFPYTEAEKAYWHELSGKVVWPLEYGYAAGWLQVLNWLKFSGLASVAICLALVSVFAGEYQSRAAAVALPTRCGKRTLPAAKVLASLLFATLYWGLCIAVLVAIHVGICGADGWKLPLQVGAFDNPYPFTVGQALLASLALGYVVVLGMVAFTLLLSAKCRTPMPVAVVPMAIVALGFLGIFIDPAAKVAVLTPFSGLSYVFSRVMVSYAAGPIVLDLHTVLALLYGVLLVACVPLAMRTWRRHQVA